MIAHDIRLWADEAGHYAECRSCEWRRGPYIRETRDDAVDAHRRFGRPPIRTTRVRYDPVTKRVVPVGDEDDAG